MQPGDCVLLATDGVFDNVPDSFIESYLSDSDIHAVTDNRQLQVNIALLSCCKRNATHTLQAICNSLTLAVRMYSQDAEYDSPFAVMVRTEIGLCVTQEHSLQCRSNGMGQVRGGKPDDITIMLVLIMNDCATEAVMAHKQ